MPKGLGAFLLGCEEMKEELKLQVLAIIVGIVVAWLGGRGVGLMSAQPLLVTGLLLGTIIGVAVFRGVPVGPLIAAGLLSLLVQPH